MKLVSVPLIVAVVLAGAACSGKSPASDLKELRRVHSGDLDVVLLSSDGNLTHGKDAVTLEFRRGNNLVDVGTDVAADQPVGLIHFLERPDREPVTVKAVTAGVLIGTRGPSLAAQGDCVACIAHDVPAGVLE